ncbi:MAG: DUF4132 domain-containing protein [Planctomycetaceae bacterium]|nr:DUF4132 domain-containing protein [Planctomycetaceae bacterium]
MAKKAAAEQAPVDDGLKWIDADRDYAVALADGKLVCRNPKGKQLASVPKWLKDSEPSQQLIALKDWLVEHQRQCLETTEMWMLRSLPLPRKVLAAVWPDPAWKDRLFNAVVCAVKKDRLVQEEAGFLREVHEKKGVGIIDLDGETQWIKTDTVAIPHPILLEELDDFRELTVELGFEQQLDQLFRQTWKPTPEQQETTSIEEYSGGKFEMLTHALGLCRRLGYKVSGGYACCPVWEAGTLVEARFWVGAEYPEEETYTADLIFADERDKTLPVKDVGAVAFSEGVRMAAAIYAKRVVEKQDDE